MKKIILISLVLAMAAGILLAQNPNRGAFDRKAPMHGEKEQCLEELKLTDAQSKKFDAARATFERQRNTFQADIDNLGLDIQDAIAAENFKLVKELNQQVTAKQLLLNNAHVDMIMAHMKELTKEQKVIMLKNMPMQMGNMCGQGQMHGNRNMRNSRMGNRNRKMDRCSDGYERCDDYDGVRKYRHRP